MVEWLANGYPPWVVYRAIIWCRLVGLDKCPGVRPTGIGDIIRRLLCNILLVFIGNIFSRVYGIVQFCNGLKVGIEGGIYHIRSLWDTHEKDDEGWGILLIDARNIMNEDNRKMMI